MHKVFYAQSQFKQFRHNNVELYVRTCKFYVHAYSEIIAYFYGCLVCLGLRCVYTLGSVFFRKSRDRLHDDGTYFAHCRAARSRYMRGYS